MIDVLNDPGGTEKLHALGVRSVPIVYRDGEFVRGQNLEDVAKFVGLHGTGHQPLPPEQLMEKWTLVLGATQRYVRQLADEQLAGRVIPNRDRSIRRLCHHIFRIGEAYLETAVDGVDFVHKLANITPPDDAFLHADEFVRYGDNVQGRLHRWWQNEPDKSCLRKVQTYFGEQTLHMLYERCTWHSAQHTRQLIAVLERLGIEPDGRVTRADLAGLPLPERLFE